MADMNLLAAICRPQTCCNADVSLLAAICCQQTCCNADVTDLLQFVANFKITLAAILLLASITVDMTTSD